MGWERRKSQLGESERGQIKQGERKMRNRKRERTAEKDRIIK